MLVCGNTGIQAWNDRFKQSNSHEIFPSYGHFPLVTALGFSRPGASGSKMKDWEGKTGAELWLGKTGNRPLNPRPRE
jgi:hypothetical protein